MADEKTEMYRINRGHYRYLCNEVEYQQLHAAMVPQYSGIILAIYKTLNG